SFPDMPAPMTGSTRSTPGTWSSHHRVRPCRSERCRGNVDADERSDRPCASAVCVPGRELLLVVEHAHGTIRTCGLVVSSTLPGYTMGGGAGWENDGMRMPWGERVLPLFG